MAMISDNILNENNAYKYDLVRIDEQFEKEIISEIPSGLTFAEKLVICSLGIPYICSIFSKSLP